MRGHAGVTSPRKNGSPTLNDSPRGRLLAPLADHHYMLSEQDFRLEADRALEQARHALLPLADREGFEVELQNGVLQLVFETPTVSKFVVSPNAPVRQIWVSAISRSYKLSWAADARVFTLDGESLNALLERLALEQIGGPDR